MNATNDPPTRIFIVGPTESLLTRRGNRHPALARFLVDRGYRLEYVTSDFYHAEKRWFSSDEIDEARRRAPYELTVMRCLGYRTNISLRRVISNILLSLKFFFYLLPRLNRKTVLILPSRPVEMIFAAALLRILRGTSVALDIQDIWPDMLVVRSRLKRFLFTLYCNVYLYMSLRFIDKFFHVAPSFVEWLHRYHPKGKSTFVPLGFDAGRWRDSPSIEEKPRTGQIRLGCVSQLTFQFDIMPVLQAIESRRTFELTVIGEDGSGERYREVAEFIESRGMDNVEIVGFVARHEMADRLRAIDVGIVPMVSTSIPNKVFDYIASSTPLLVLGENDSADFVRDHDVGWNVSYDEQGIGEFLDSLSREDISAKMRNVARIRDNFDRDNLHQRILRLIEGGSQSEGSET